MLKKQLFLLEFFPPHLQLTGWEMGWDIVNRYLEMIIEQQQQYKYKLELLRKNQMICDENATDSLPD